MNNTIYPCLWFDGQAKEAANFYCDIFGKSKIVSENPVVVEFEIEGKKIIGLNGGPMFTINPSISMMVTCETKEEIERIWKGLMEGGKAMMALNTYSWSELYGWVADKYGMTWQLMLAKLPEGAQKITTSFLFANTQYGRGQEAIKYYTSIFPDSAIHTLQLYEAGEPQAAGNLKFGHFSLNGEVFAAMDGPGDHNFTFNEAVSITVSCDTQEDIDHYWNALAQGGKESRCGWLVDRFGVSWQIVPKALGKMMSNPEKGKRVMAEIMKMKKLDIAKLESA